MTHLGFFQKKKGILVQLDELDEFYKVINAWIISGCCAFWANLTLLVSLKLTKIFLSMKESISQKPQF